jgi:hypothetical protein
VSSHLIYAPYATASERVTVQRPPARQSRRRRRGWCIFSTRLRASRFRLRVRRYGGQVGGQAAVGSKADVRGGSSLGAEGGRLARFQTRSKCSCACVGPVSLSSR